eukprot:TRINITY_DN11110_c0_g1_i1.p1 TRINITY_DN11110_c0_g1~~TRINITY_DN11110_c0_g1_i1.p1  ORF type:complete len:410 (+),score=105.17 TRINITY_DN11110_c0_g1_i1:44-1273(+)
MGKESRKRTTGKHTPLHSQYAGPTLDESDQSKPHKKKSKNQITNDGVVPEKISHRVLTQVREQQQELESDILTREGTGKTVDLEVDEEYTEFYDESEEEQINPEDEDMLAMFFPEEQYHPTGTTIGDLIMEAIKAKEAGIDNPEALRSSLDSKIIRVYTEIATILKRYRSGKIPKAVTIIPQLTNWEEILFLTKPEEWSLAAVGYMTKLFASNLQEAMAQRYYNFILLPRIRDNIAQYKKLNFHLYQALKKSLYKPSAFYKGILIPLCEAGDCTLREAIIVSSVLKKTRVPLIPSSVALLKLAEMPFAGPSSIFLRTLIEKRYALPYRVIDTLVDYFVSFKNTKGQLPVIWHKALLSFAQRYKTELTSEQKQRMKFLLRDKFHQQITDEVRRELFNSKCRDDPEEMTTD